MSICRNVFYITVKKPVNPNHTINKYVQSVLLCLCIIFVAFLILESTHEYPLTQVDKVASNSKKKLTRLTSQNFALPPLSDFSVIVERPLFTHDRNPYIADEIVDEANQPDKEQFKTKGKLAEYLLSAIIITEDRRIALIQAGTDKKLQKVEEGETIDGWTLTDFKSDEISLIKGQEIKKIGLLADESRGREHTASTSETSATTTTDIPEEPVKVALPITPPDFDKISMGFPSTNF